MNGAIKLLFGGWITKGHLSIIDSDGKLSSFGNPAAWPKVTLRFHDSKLPLQLMGDFVLAMGEAYMDQRFTIEQGRIYDLLELLASNYAGGSATLYERIRIKLSPILRKFTGYNSIKAARKNVEHHYDLSYALYKLFLDEDMQYSCAYFRHKDDSLETAQLQKKHHIAAKLLLRPGMKVLDIGCGWGGMALYLSKHYQVEVTGLTLSEEQLKIAQDRAAREGLSDKVKFYLRDYREETNEYDRIVSVGMFEHVGIKNYPEFFAKVKTLLKDDGVMLLHAIGSAERSSAPNPWVQKYIFPGGYVPSVSEVFPSIEDQNLWATDMEILRLHYAETLRQWWMRFNENRAEVAKIYDERFCRMWEFYLCGAEVNFRYLNIMVFQIQLAKNIDAVPITRDYMYEAENAADIRFVYQLPANKNIGPPMLDSNESLSHTADR